MFTETSLKKLIDFDARKQYLIDFFEKLSLRYNCGEHLPLLRFLNNYTAWNASFALGVTSLTSMIGERHDLFRDLNCKINAIADRSIYVASFVYDASRDEFNDSLVPSHAPHRSLAQALMARIVEIHEGEFDYNSIFEETDKLAIANNTTMFGYTGGSYQDCFYGMGYHAASEILADMEFTALDRMFKECLTDLFDKLHNVHVNVAGIELRPYHWIRAHSGHGAAVEQSHYAYALKAINEGLRFSTIDPQYCIDSMQQGFRRFAMDQLVFFDDVSLL